MFSFSYRSSLQIDKLWNFVHQLTLIGFVWLLIWPSKLLILDFLHSIMPNLNDGDLWYLIGSSFFCCLWLFVWKSECECQLLKWWPNKHWKYNLKFAKWNVISLMYCDILERWFDKLVWAFGGLMLFYTNQYIGCKVIINTKGSFKV